MDTTTVKILKFLGSALLTVAPPLACAVGWYVCADPFKVIRDYDGYFSDPVANPVRVGINKGLITVNNYHRRVADGQRYNGFIFGSSISCYYDAKEWAALAGRPGEVSPYHFDSSGESIEGMAQKVEYLDGIGQNIDYALLVLDPIIMENEYSDTPAGVNPPRMHKSLIETLNFHYKIFRAGTNADFFKSWIPASIEGIPFNNGHNLLFQLQPIIYDSVTNQETMPMWDSMISSDPKTFYADHQLAEPPEAATVAAAHIKGIKGEALRTISRIFGKNNTDYQVIISPNRRKVMLNPADLDSLDMIFGKGRVHDFSHTMVDALTCDTLLYDNTHYRPAFALRLMREVYLSR